MCVSFVYELQDLQFRVDSQKQSFEKHFMAIFLFTLRVLASNLLREIGQRNIFIFTILCLTRGLNSDLTFYKTTHYLLDYGDILQYIDLKLSLVNIKVIGQCEKDLNGQANQNKISALSPLRFSAQITTS